MNNKKKSGIYLFSLLGFKVRLDWSWLFLAILVVWTLAAGYFPFTFPHQPPETYWVMGVIGALGLFLSIILHELCHSLVGRHYGVPIGGITLFIFGGVAEMRDAMPSPKAEFFMSIAGPLLSLGLGVLFYLLYLFGLQANFSIPVIGVIKYLSLINFVLGIFNLLPGFPLDGGRVLRSILWWWKDNLKWATHIACKMGSGLAYLMIIYGALSLITGAIISGIWLVLLGFFLLTMSKMSYQEFLIREIFGGEQIKKYVKTNLITVPPAITLQELADTYLYQYYHKLYPVVENGDLIGCISIRDMKQIEKDKWPSLTVRQVMKQCSDENTLDCNTKVMKVLQQMNLQKINRFIVTDHGKLYGIITLKDMMDVISMRLSLEEGHD